jgi:hypothetical protein
MVTPDLYERQRLVVTRSKFMYDSKLMNEQVRAFVEGCDCVLGTVTLVGRVS